MRNRTLVALLASIPLVFTAAGCGGSDPDLSAAREFDRYPLYWLGERFEEWDLETIDGLDDAEFITFVYGDCTPHGGDQPSCTPPLQIQVSPLCQHLEIVARAPIWRERHVRGAPVGTLDSAPVLFTAAAQVKVYRGEGTDAGLPMRALRALRSANHVWPVIGSSGRIPAPPRDVLAGKRRCRA